MVLKLAEWLLSSSITRLVLAIKSLETNETLERWQFDIDIHADDPANANGTKAGGPPPAATGKTNGKKKEKTEKEVQSEIREIMKQITSSMTFLPVLDEECKCRTGAGIVGSLGSASVQVSVSMGLFVWTIPQDDCLGLPKIVLLGTRPPLSPATCDSRVQDFPPRNSQAKPVLSIYEPPLTPRYIHPLGIYKRLNRRRHPLNMG